MSIQSKHFINLAGDLVLESLTGLCDVNPQLTLDEQNKIVYIKDNDRSKVALMCGGGSGHEPAHSAFVGQGILTAAVCGSIFASPNASQVRRGIDLVDNDQGTVIIVKNYTGDVLNFGLAKEQYAALRPEKAEKLRFVVVGDDVAVGRAQGKIVGRRGLAGTVLVYKIAGALANRGADLDQVYNIAEYASANIATIGVSLGHVHVPGTAATTSNLSFSELEIGMGIHNESGNSRISPIPPLSKLIPQLLDFLTSTTDADRSFVPFNGEDRVVLLVNNLGGVSDLELTGIVAETRKQLDSRGFQIERILSGIFMTSLNMPGFSITLLRLPGQNEPSSPSPSLILSLLDEKADVPGWKWSSPSKPLKGGLQITKETDVAASQAKLLQLRSPHPEKFVASIQHAANALIAAEPEITRMDSIAGDGDCGLTLKAGAEGVLGKIGNGTITGENVVGSFIAISQVAEEIMGGTSGALYSIFFSGLAQGFQSQTITQGSILTLEHWAVALTSALAKLYSYTRARPPSRTLVDPLAAFVDSVNSNKAQNFAEAVESAGKVAVASKDLDAKAGRSAYVEGDVLKKEQVPDPGAWGVKTILENLDI